MEFIAKIFKNSANGQRMLCIPKNLDKLKVDKLPDLVKVKISIPKLNPKDYLAKVQEVLK